jgi:hypothetical protein
MLSKDQYLCMTVVKGFIEYLASLIDGVPFSHVIVIRDPKLPLDDSRIVNPKFFIDSLESAFNGYWWNKGGYVENSIKLQEIQCSVRSSLNSVDTTDTLDALREVLMWGAGGTGQRLYTANYSWAMKRLPILLDSLRLGRTEMISATPNLNHFKPSQNPIYARMNAGYTKYYALACDDVVIYDGRVGAALGLIAKTFCKSNDIYPLPNELAFRWGAQNGKNPLNRDPSDAIYKFGRLPAEGAAWAEWNIKASWLLNSALNKSNSPWCSGLDGLRRIEAALFVIGYSIPEA